MTSKSILNPDPIDLGVMGVEHPRYERINGRPSEERVLKESTQLYGKGVDDLRTNRRGEEKEGKKVAIYLMKRLCNMKLGEVAKEFGAKSSGTVGWACHGIN